MIIAGTGYSKAGDNALNPDVAFVTPSGTNRMILAFMYEKVSTPLAASITNIGAMTQLIQMVNPNSTTNKIGVYYMLEADLPDGEITETVNFTLDGVTRFTGILGVMSFVNVKQEVPEYQTYYTGNSQQICYNDLDDIVVNAYGVQIGTISDNNLWASLTGGTMCINEEDTVSYLTSAGMAYQKQTVTGNLAMEMNHISGTGFLSSIMMGLLPAKISLFPQVNIV